VVAFQAALPNQPGVFNLFAEDPLRIDISELASGFDTNPSTDQTTDSTASLRGQPVQWRHTGIGDASICSSFFNSASVERYNQPGSCLSVSSAQQAGPDLPESGSDENCTVYIIEQDLSDTNMIYEIHTPAVAEPIDMIYAIDFIADDGSYFEQAVNLCIHP